MARSSINKPAIVIVIKKNVSTMKKKTLFCSSLVLGLMVSSCSTFQLVNSEVYNNANLADYHTFRIVAPDSESLPPGMELVTYYNIAAAIREQMMERGFQEDPSSPVVINIGLTVSKQYETEPVGALMPPPAPPIITAPAPPPPAPAPGPGPGMTPPPGGGGRGPMPSDAPQALNPPAPPAPAPAPSHFFNYVGPGPAPAFAPYFMMPRSYYWGINPNAQVVTGVYKEGVLTMDIVDMNTKTALYSSSVATIMEPGDAQFRNLKGIAEAVQTLFSKFPVPLLPQYRNQK